jgi:hypothetical protein
MGALKEHHLHRIWHDRNLGSDRLRTSDGRSLAILDPGIPNSDGGPDFRHARVRIGSVLFVGDVEIHRRVVDWMQHGHQTDPAYNGVILHVVLEGDPLHTPTVTSSGRTIPTLILRPLLTGDPDWHIGTNDVSFREIACARVNSHVDGNVLEKWIVNVARERLELKIRRYEERLRELAMRSQLHIQDQRRHYGAGYDPDRDPWAKLTPSDFSARSLWDQILYEGIMDGLGFSRNREPFVRLSRSLDLRSMQIAGVGDDVVCMEALLFGVSGLLPQTRDIRQPASRNHVRSLRRHWRRLRGRLSCERLHPADWKFFPMRPSNFPTVRIAAAAELIRRILLGDLFRLLIGSFRDHGPPAGIVRFWINMLSVAPSSFWKSHVRFDGPSKAAVTPLGAARARDIAANVFIPIALLYARIFHDVNLRTKALAVYEAFPALSTNGILRRMGSQLLKGRVALDRMAVQQGALQLWGSYCREERCAECDVGKLVFKM